MGSDVATQIGYRFGVDFGDMEQNNITIFYILDFILLVCF